MEDVADEDVPLRRQLQMQHNTITELRLTIVQKDETIKLLQLEVTSLNAELGTYKRPKLPPLVNDPAVTEKLSSCRSVLSLLNAFPTLQTFSMNGLVDSFDGIKCNACVKPNNSKHAHFNYNSTENEVDFTQFSISSQFKNLKLHISHHFKSASHLANTNQPPPLRSTVVQSQNYLIGKRLGLLAYAALKDQSNCVGFEDQVAVISRMDVDLGSINHSRQFVMELRPHFYEILHGKFLEQCNTILPGTGRKAPFSLMCDGMTPDRTTCQAVACIMYVNGNLDAYFLDFPVVTGGDGVNTTKDLVKVLENQFQVGFEPRLVGMAFDGLYLIKNVDKHMITELHLLADIWRSFSWDISHLIELADKDVGIIGTAKEEVEHIVKELNKKYFWGKKYAKLKAEGEKQASLLSVNDEAEEEAAGRPYKVLRPKPFSETRWATYYYDVIKNFWRNYPCLRRLCEDNEKLQHLVSKLSSIKFCLCLSGVMDIYKQISMMSKASQSVRTFTWMVSQNVLRGCEILRYISEDLLKDHPTFAYCSTLKAAVEEIENEETFQKMPVHSNAGEAILTRQQEQQQSENARLGSFGVSFKKLSFLAKSLAESVEQRLTGEDTQRPPIFEIVEKVFPLKNVLSYDHANLPADVLTSLDEYLNLAKTNNYMEPNISSEDIKAQYSDFVSTVQTKFSEDGNGFLSDEYEYKTYTSILATANLFPDFAHLLLSAITRTTCEAVVEGMGSVVKDVLYHRQNLKHQSLVHEAFIRWNAPNAAQISDTTICEALDKHFKGRANWRFTKVSDPARLKNPGSKVIERKQGEPSRIHN